MLIRTLPPSGNFGGVLQAYALQEVLRQLGASPVTDVSRADRPDGIRASTKYGIKSGFCRMPGADRIAPPAWHREVIKRERAKPLRPFVDQRIAMTAIYQRGRVNPAALAGTDVFLAGSDQVWRPGYGDVLSYLFDFAPSGATLASYAASFGRSDLDGYSPRVLEESRTLAQRFAAISVREADAIRICQERWGVDAVQHVDPTMLLTAEHYRDFAQTSEDDHSGRPYLLSFLLDQTSTMSAAVSHVTAALGIAHRDLLPRWPQRARELGRRAPGIPTVEQWLGAFADSSFVITDSFHGTVFAVLNRKPFITLANSFRGVARFTSLLGLLGLSDRLVYDGRADELNRAFDHVIDWGDVNARVDIERRRGREYLSSLLNASGSSSQTTFVDA
ncbi:polysaccharide pyruvyl transferase family protein [Agromyces agglutinans]|uniref:polysaccharide pyruvyl transferase family protein n=1 Tax=Agromyces agglutinans TaxID=2662258 RepID=UPI001562BE5F|nr:polysaccharide pyruvyl transferase family protein [Agromyces agglutinans]